MQTLNRLFLFSNFIVLPGWIILFAWPSLAVTKPEIILALTIPVSLVYGYSLFFGQRHDLPDDKRHGNFFSLRGVTRLWDSSSAVLAGWVHYLAFDLLVGLFIVMDAAKADISHWWLLPCLFLTLMFGPLGLLVYLLLKLVLIGSL